MIDQTSNINIHIPILFLLHYDTLQTGQWLLFLLKISAAQNIYVRLMVLVTACLDPLVNQQNTYHLVKLKGGFLEGVYCKEMIWSEQYNKIYIYISKRESVANL